MRSLGKLPAATLRWDDQDGGGSRGPGRQGGLTRELGSRGKRSHGRTLLKLQRTMTGACGSEEDSAGAVGSKPMWEVGKVARW